MRLSRFKKLMLEAVAFSLTPAQITILRAEFNAIDTDRSLAHLFLLFLAVAVVVALLYPYLCSTVCVPMSHFPFPSSLLFFLLPLFPPPPPFLNPSPYLSLLYIPFNFAFSFPLPYLILIPFLPFLSLCRSGTISLVELQEYVAKVRITSHIIPSNLISFHFISFYLIPSHFISSHVTLFYRIILQEIY